MPPMWCLPTVELLDAPLPSPGSSAVRVPRLPRYYQGAMTSRRSSRRASFPSHGRYHSKRSCFAHTRPSAAAGESPGVGHPVSPAGTLVSGNGRISYVPGEPRLCSCPALRPRRDRRIWPKRCAGVAPVVSTTKAPAFVLSRLNHTASALAVYASQAGSPRRHARLASGCWPDSSGRAWLPAGFHRKVSRCILHPSSFPKFNVAQGRHT